MHMTDLAGQAKYQKLSDVALKVFPRYDQKL